MTLALTAEWVPTQAEFDTFARISGDDNPIHVSPEFAEATGFGRTVCHGMLIYARLWALVVSARPGTRHRRQNLMFPNPCFAGEAVRLSVREDGPSRLNLTATRVSDGAAVLAGVLEVD